MNKETNQEATPTPSTSEQLEAQWKHIGLKYSKLFSRGFIGKGVTMANVVNVREADTILEVACGDGSISAELCLMKKEGAKLICSDLSGLMCQIAYLKLSELLELKSQPGGLFQLQDKLSKKAIGTCKQEEDFEKGQKKEIPGLNAEVIQANAEDLSVIQSSSVDVYFASLCLSLVEDPQKMLSEAYRVLKPSGRAIFSIAGSKELAYIHKEMPKLYKEYGVEIPPKRDAFYMNDREKTIGILEEAGFQNVLAWRQFLPFLFTTEEKVDYLVGEYFYGPFKKACPEKVDEMVEKYSKALKGVLKEKHQPLGFEALILMGEKKA